MRSCLLRTSKKQLAAKNVVRQKNRFLHILADLGAGETLILYINVKSQVIFD